MQIFLTANPKLRSEVAKQFHKLRAAVLHDPEEAKRLEELSNQDYPILDQIPSDAFPLFWDSEHYLRAADATLAKPFFPRSGCRSYCCTGLRDIPASKFLLKLHARALQLDDSLMHVLLSRPDLLCV